MISKKDLFYIRKFFHSICHDNSASKEEVINYLESTKNYILMNNGLSTNKNVRIHFISNKKLANEHCCAYMSPTYKIVEGKDVITGFDIYLNEKYSSYKLKNNISKETDEEDECIIPLGEDSLKFLNSLLSFNHEMHHVVQYLTIEEKIDKTFQKKYTVQEAIYKVENFMMHSSKQREYKKFLNHILDNIELVGSIEFEANTFQFLYLINTLSELIEYEYYVGKDEQLIDMLQAYSIILIENLKGCKKQLNIDKKNALKSKQRLIKTDFNKDFGDLLNDIYN